MKISRQALQLLEKNKKNLNIKDITAFIESCIAIKIAKLIKSNKEKLTKTFVTPEEINKQHELRIKNETLVEVLDLLLEGD